MDQSSILQDGATSEISKRNEHPSQVRLSLAATLVCYWTRYRFRLGEDNTRRVLSRVFPAPSLTGPGEKLRQRLWNETVAAITELPGVLEEERGVSEESADLNCPCDPEDRPAESALLARSALESLDDRVPQRWLVIANRVWVEHVGQARVAEAFHISLQDVDQQLQNVSDALWESLVAFDDFFEHPTEIIDGIRRSAATAGELVACRYVALDWICSHADSTLYSKSLEELTNGDGVIGPLDGELAPSPMLFVRERVQKGGLSDIWLAEDDRGRTVVVKTLRDGVKQNRSMRLRFQREIAICTRLTHPGIVSVIDHGFDSTGNAYFSMPLIRGNDLREIIRMKTLSRRELVRHIIDAANAVSFAHSNGVVHRDLKPHNIMVGDFGETVVIDWGLAKTLEESDIEDNDLPLHETERLEGTRGQAGTPSYMSPEQARGEPSRDEVGIRSDVYGLGATLYTALVGESPFANIERDQAVKHVVKGDFPLPRQIDTTIPRPLQAIVLKAMSLDPKDRYADAAAFATELQAWLDDQPVLAYRQTLVESVSRWVRKNQAVSGALIPLLLCIVLGLAWNSNQIRARNRKLELWSKTLAEKAIESIQNDNRLDAKSASEFAFEISEELHQKTPSEQNSLMRLDNLRLYALATHKSFGKADAKYSAQFLYRKLFQELDAHETDYGVSRKSRLIRIVGLGDRGLTEANTDAKKAIRTYQLALELAATAEVDAPEDEQRELEIESCTQLGNIGDAYLNLRHREANSMAQEQRWMENEIEFRSRSVRACIEFFDRSPTALPSPLKPVLAVQVIRLGSVLIQDGREREAAEIVREVLKRDGRIEMEERYNAAQQVWAAACFVALANHASSAEKKLAFHNRAIQTLWQAIKAHQDNPYTHLSEHLERDIFETLGKTNEFQRIRRESLIIDRMHRAKKHLPDGD